MSVGIPARDTLAVGVSDGASDVDSSLGARLGARLGALDVSLAALLDASLGASLAVDHLLLLYTSSTFPPELVLLALLPARVTIEMLSPSLVRGTK